MTVSSELNRKEYAGNGVTTVFATSPVIFFDASDLEVYDVLDSTGVATLKTITTDYTVSGGAGSTGTVTMLTAPASGHTLVIVRSLPLTQADDFVQNDASDAEVVEDALDRQTMIAQQLSARIDRSVRLPDSDTSGADTELPVPVANMFLAWNSDADALENVAGVDGVAGDLAVALANTSDTAKGDALIGVKLDATGAVARTQHEVNESLPIRSGFNSDANFDAAVAAIASPQLSALQSKFIQSGTGAVATTAQSKSREIISVYDFMSSTEKNNALTVGTVDLSAAIMRAHDALPTAGGVVELLQGGYGIGSTMSFTKPIILRGRSRENVTLTRLFKLSTLSGPAIDINVSGVVLENFALAGQAGNGGNGIDILDRTSTLRNITVVGMGQDGIRIGDAIASNCNLWLMEGVECANNTRHGVYLDSSSTNAGGGTAIRLFVHDNGGDGLKLDRAQLNTFIGIVSEANTGYGINLESGARDNTFYGGDSENNTAGNLNKSALAIRNNIFATWGSFCIGARVSNSGVQSIPDATLTALTFDTELFDTDACHSTSSNTSRLTCVTAGKYAITGHAIFASNATGQRLIGIKLNGSTYIAMDNKNPVSGDSTYMSIATTYNLAVGDYVELFVYQNSTGALNTVIFNNAGSQFSMIRQN